MPHLDATHDPKRRSWVTSANGHPDFPIQNLPLGVFSPPGGGTPRAGVAIGDMILDLAARRPAGLFAGEAARAAEAAAGGVAQCRCSPLGAGPRRALRAQLSELLTEGSAEANRLEGMLHRAADCTMHLPAHIGDYTDFYVGIHHATNVGKLFRPDNPLLPNYKYVPIGYHGRASSIVPSGTPVRRPNGQRKRPDEAGAELRPVRSGWTTSWSSGVWIGPGNALGEPIPIGEAGEHVAGFCLLNDWSARDIQAWEYQPLGPFLSKNFGSTISPWVITPGGARPLPQPAAAAAGGRSGAAALSAGRGGPARGRPGSRTRSAAADAGAAREGSAAAPAVLEPRRAHVLDAGADGRAPHLQRLQPAAGRPARHGHDLGARRGGLRQPAGDDAGREDGRCGSPQARSAAFWRTATR